VSRAARVIQGFPIENDTDQNITNPLPAAWSMAAVPLAVKHDVPVPRGACTIPAAAQAYVFGARGFLTLWAQGQIQPTVSTLNALDAAVTSNMRWIRPRREQSARFRG
jgi:hypothetical protein